MMTKKEKQRRLDMLHRIQNLAERLEKAEQSRDSWRDLAVMQRAAFAGNWNKRSWELVAQAFAEAEQFDIPDRKMAQ